MKGCLAVVGVLTLLLVVLIAGCTGFVMYKGHELGQEHELALARLRQTNSAAFAAPEDGLLAEDRLATWFRVRGEAVAPLDRMFSKAQDLKRMEDGDVGFFEGVSAAFGAVKGIAKSVMEVPGALATGLEGAGMSFDEYAWINGVVHATVRRAARAGEEPAVAMADAIDKSFDSVEMRSEGKEFDPERLDRLEDRISEWKPENLALISARAQDLTASPALLMLDVFALNMEDQLAGGTSEPSATDEGG
ncbi:MAG: hypothetical protein ACF8XB_02695 [Planctomycetota bacterium JB042]